MSYHDQSWSNNASRSATWEQSTPPARSGASSAHTNRDEQTEGAFVYQFEEIDRAMDNLAKSGKYFGGGPPRGVPGPMMGMPMPNMGRSPYGTYGPHMGSRPGSIDFDPMRSQSASHARNFYASQRYQGGPVGGMGEDNYTIGYGGGKRRGAAARERDLRNWHQEQQMSRGPHPGMGSESSSFGPDASQAPTSQSGFGFPASQGHGSFSNGLPTSGHEGFNPQNGFIPRHAAHGAGGSSHNNAHRGASPFDAFAMTGTNHHANVAGRENGQPTSKPEQNGQSGTGPQTSNGVNNRAPSASASPANGSNGNSARISAASGPTSTPAIAPIGSRPVTNPPLSKRATTPLTSPMTQSFTNAGQSGNDSSSNDKNKDEKRSSTTPGPSNNTNGMTSASTNGVSNAWASGKSGNNIWGPPKAGGNGGAQGNVWG